VTWSREDGRPLTEQDRINIAYAMLEWGFTKQEAAQNSGLTIEVVEALLERPIGARLQ
jgi:hypothetical protein